MDNRPIINIGGGLSNMLFITFLVLKLTKVIDWSWWWITCPLWGGLAIILAVIIVIALVYVLAEMLK